MRIGNARVSSTRTDWQDHKTQIDMLKAAGRDQFLTERGSGGSSDRPVMHQVLDGAMAAAARGEKVDVVVVRLDRCVRSLTDVPVSLERLKAARVNFIILTESIDLSTAAGVLASTFLGAAAQYERSILRERVIGTRPAKGPSGIGRRPRSLTPAKVAPARRLGDDEGQSAKAVAARLGVPSGTLLRALGCGDLAGVAS